MTSDLMFPATASEQNKPSFIQTANRQKDFCLEKKKAGVHVLLPSSRKEGDSLRRGWQSGPSHGRPS